MDFIVKIIENFVYYDIKALQLAALGELTTAVHITILILAEP